MRLPFCNHDYSKWSYPVDGYNSNYKDQFSQCKKCGKIKRRSFGHSISITAKSIIDALQGSIK